MKTENWVQEETMKHLKKRAELEVKKRKAADNLLLKRGWKKVMVDHPTIRNCKVEKWIKP